MEDYDIIRHNVGVRPGRKGGVRVERTSQDGQEIVHAYGKWKIPWFRALIHLQARQGMFKENELLTLMLIFDNLGFSSGGYIHSFGGAQEVVDLVDDILLSSSRQSKI